MSKKLDEMLYDSLKPEDVPEPELNRRILERRSEKNMKKFNVRKAAAAAVIAGVVAMGGITAYAATQNISLLSVFKGESREVKENATQLLDTNVKQGDRVNEEQSKWAHFQIKEAICDRNQVAVLVEVRAAEPEKYLLVPAEFDPDTELVVNMDIKGVTGRQTIREYAESIGKKCMKVHTVVDCEASSESLSYSMDEKGVLYYTIRFDNEEKSRKLDYVCKTCVYPPEGGPDSERMDDEIPFTLTDKSDITTLRYVPVSDQEIQGTKLAVDEVIFEKSSLDMVCRVKYHYTGSRKDTKTQKKWIRTKEADICFFMLDGKGNIIDFNGGSGNSFPDQEGKMEESWHYSLADLPDTIVFQAKDVCEKELYGTVEVKLAE